MSIERKLIEGYENNKRTRLRYALFYDYNGHRISSFLCVKVTLQSPLQRRFALLHSLAGCDCLNADDIDKDTLEFVQFALALKAVHRPIAWVAGRTG